MDLTLSSPKLKTKGRIRVCVNFYNDVYYKCDDFAYVNYKSHKYIFYYL